VSYFWIFHPELRHAMGVWSLLVLGFVAVVVALRILIGKWSWWPDWLP
jgi:hypothetical protein